VATVARAVDEVLEGTVRDSGVRPRFDCADAHIDADPDQFRQVLINLVQNAMQAQDGDGSVRVVARSVGDMVEVVVEDEGPGIPESLRERVFEPFYTTRQQGSGLGLSIARELTERNGGSLDIVSRDPRGTAIVMRWPAARGGKR
jgi:signal transduction histidine kinase